MKKIIAFFCGCNKPSKPAKKRKPVQVGMTKKDWEREDANLKWIDNQAASCYPVKRIQQQKVPRIAHQFDRSYNILAFIH